MSNFPKIHGLEIAGNGYIINSVVENLTADPMSPSAGQSWFNTTSKRYKYAGLDGSNAVDVKTFGTYEEFNTYVTNVASQSTNASGASLVGYDGNGGGSLFSLPNGTVADALDSITQAVATTRQNIADLGSGSLTNMQTEINTIESAVGLGTLGAYIAPVGSNYLGVANTVMEAIVALDSQAKTSADDILAEITARMGGDSTLTTNLNTEITTRTSADTTLTNNLNSEITARTAADTTLQNNINAEASTRAGADTILQNNINAEASTRAGVDAIIQADVDTRVKKAGDTMTGNLVMSGGSTQITLPNAPVAGTDATNKNYVDAIAAGLTWKNSVKAATTANITLSGTQTIDTVAVTAGQRVLVKNQTDATQNGIYNVVSGGAWTRATDMDQTTPINEVNGAAVYVEGGSVNGHYGFTVTGIVDAIGTDTIDWSQFTGAMSLVAGVGMSIVGNTMSVKLGAGIYEGPSTEVGVDCYAAGGLWTTLDGTSASTNTDAQVGIKLADGSLTVDAFGLKVSSSTFSTLATNLTNAVAAEATLRINADLAEVTARMAGDAGQAAALLVEVTNRTAADTTLQNNINAEITARTAGDATNAADIVTEASARMTADNLIIGDLNAEITARINGDLTEITARTTAVAAEASARGAADTTLTNNLNAEITARMAADQVEITARTAADNSIISALDAETTARIAGDASLTTSINAVKTAINDHNYVYQSSTPTTSHVISHGLNTPWLNICVYAFRDGAWHNDLAGIVIDTNNQFTINLTDSVNVRVMVTSLATYA